MLLFLNIISWLVLVGIYGPAQFIYRFGAFSVGMSYAQAMIFGALCAGLRVGQSLQNYRWQLVAQAVMAAISTAILMMLMTYHSALIIGMHALGVFVVFGGCGVLIGVLLFLGGGIITHASNQAHELNEP